MGNFGIKIITDSEEFHTSDIGLKMTALKIPQPKAKTNYVNVPGASGSIDLSEVYGSVVYENRDGLTFTFVLRNDFDSWAAAVQSLAAKIHGKKCKVIVDNDRNYYYVCRLAIDYEKSRKAVGTITISGSAEPFKYDIFASDERWEWDPFDFERGVIRELIDMQITATVNTVTIPGATNYRTPVFVVTKSNNLKFTHNNRTYDLSKPGTYRFPAVRVGDESLTLTFTGTGTLTVKFRGAYL